MGELKHTIGFSLETEESILGRMILTWLTTCGWKLLNKVQVPLRPFQKKRSRAVQIELKEICTSLFDSSSHCVVAEISGVGPALQQLEMDKEQLGEFDCLSCAMTIYTDPLYCSNPLVSSEPQVCPICIVGVFEYKSGGLKHFMGIMPA